MKFSSKIFVLFTLSLGLSSPNAFSQDHRDKQVDEAIKKAQNFLFSKMQNGHWNGFGKGSNTPPKKLTLLSGKEVTFQPDLYPLGPTAIATYALLESGMSPHDPKISQALDYLLKEPTASTYVLGLRANAFLAALNRTDNTRLKKRYRQGLLQDSEQLIFSTKIGTYGYFSYGDRTGSWAGRGELEKQRTDNSNGQYGVLGVWAAARADNEVPRKYWEIIEKHWVDSQRKEGYWTYLKTGDQNDAKYKRLAPMTAAGLATLFICFEMGDNREFLKCKKSDLPESLTRGLAWFDKNYPAFGSRNNGYLLYGIERVGLASGYKYFGKTDWYKLGRKIILEKQSEDGQFRLEYGSVVGTSYGLLFLARGRNPIIFNKLEFKGDWNNRPRDMANLTHRLSRNLERTMNWQIVNLQVPSEELHDAPILYISGSKTPEFTDEELQKLRDFVYQGGLILSVAECNGRRFRKGIREIYTKLFPDYEMTKCGPTHPLYSAHLKIRHGKPGFYEISNGVRPLVLHTDIDLSRAWQQNSFITQKDYFQIMTNILLYSQGDLNGLRPRGISHWPAEDTNASAKAAMKVARLKWAGQCNPEPLAVQRLARLLKKQDGLEVTFPGDTPDAPLLSIEKLPASGIHLAWLSGTGALNISDKEKEALKLFVSKGGVLLVEAAGGNTKFAESAEAWLKATWGEKNISYLAEDSPIYQRNGGTLQKALWQKKSRKRFGERTQFRLKGISVNSKPAVLFSPEDITAGLLGTPQGTVDGYAPQSAFALMRNILHYAKENAEKN